jgi:hypothetical protein
MKFFLFVSILTGVLLGTTIQLGLQKTPVSTKVTPPFLVRYKSQVKEQFKKPENATILFSFITGNKSGISPYTKNAFKKLNLSFLLSPSGIHFSALFIFVAFFLKKIKSKWIRYAAKASIVSSLFLLPNFEALKRLGILRLLFQVKFLAKLKISLEKIFFLTFSLSFILGQYKASPLGFIFSFAFLGTFFSLRDSSKITLILGLFSTQLILALFLGDKVSLLSIPCGLFGSFLFTLIFPVFVLFLLTFWAIPLNWVEPLLQLYIKGIQLTSKLLNGSFTSSSIFLILATWILMFHKTSPKKYMAFCVLLFLHTNTAMNPVIYSPR